MQCPICDTHKATRYVVFETHNIPTCPSCEEAYLSLKQQDSPSKEVFYLLDLFKARVKEYLKAPTQEELSLSWARHCWKK